MIREKILLVEDAESMQMIVKATIGQDCDLTCASSVTDANNMLKILNPALMILDVMLPDGTGFDFCKKVRAEESFKFLPIIFLTGEDQINQRVLGFDLGADDYIVKPFEPEEFRARIFSKLKRKQIDTSNTNFSLGNFCVDWTSQKAFLHREGVKQELSLTPIEFKLLIHFLRNQNQIFSREELLVAVWGGAVHVSGHTVDTHISSLRKKVGEYGHFFKAVVKRGYCFSPEDKKASAS